MLRSLRSRRQPRYGAQVCAVIAAVLLLVSVSVLHSRLGLDHRQLSSKLGLQNQNQNLEFGQDATDDIDAVVANPLLEDIENNNNNSNRNNEDDRIDELDVIEEDDDQSKFSNEDDILRGVEVEEESDLDGVVVDNKNNRNTPIQSSGYYYDHVFGVTRRRAFGKHSSSSSIDDDPWEDSSSAFDFSSPSSSSSQTKIAFGSDDEPVDEDVRNKLDGIRRIEDALLINPYNKGKSSSKTGGFKGKGIVSPLRKGWAPWFEKKGDFLRRDRMFKSNFELLNPLHNHLLQDPDGVGFTSLTKGDRLIQKTLFTHLLRNNSPFPILHAIKKTTTSNYNVDAKQNQVKRVERRTLDENTRDSQQQTKYADGQTWGYFPGLYSHLSFSDFMDEFFTKGNCPMRVFMVWNSPSWMFTVRHQRGLESLLYHHPDACVVVFSETIQLDFFKDFVKDGFKVAVAMPNLDELLKNTPTHVFASLWFEWRKTIFYPTHYSELVRLAALYKYGGLYLDSDILVLKQLSSLNDSVGLEDYLAEGSLNGALLLFKKDSLFLMECLNEFYLTYDDTQLRWNGADLLTRASNRLLRTDSKSDKLVEVRILPSSMFFPIGSSHIARYFVAPANVTERAQQDILLRKILDESYAFHFWNSITSALVPEPNSLVARLLDRHCIRCLDVV